LALDSLLVFAVGTAEERNRLGRLRVPAPLDPGPRPALRAPQIALEAVSLVGVGGAHPSEEDVLASPPRLLQEPLAQVDVVPADPLHDEAPRADTLDEIDAGAPGRDRPRHV